MRLVLELKLMVLTWHLMGLSNIRGSCGRENIYFYLCFFGLDDFCLNSHYSLNAYSGGIDLPFVWIAEGYGNSAAVKALGANPSYS